MEWYIGAQNKFIMEEKVVEELCPYSQIKSVSFDVEVSVVCSGNETVGDVSGSSPMSCIPFLGQQFNG
jgi:hypothetical protein